jgi:hypothetical protein
MGKKFPVYPQRPDRLWDPSSLLFNGYRGFFPRKYEMKQGWIVLVPTAKTGPQHSVLEMYLKAGDSQYRHYIFCSVS